MYLATGGLLAFRSGNIAQGRSLYQSARGHAASRALRGSQVHALTLIFQAREEMLAAPHEALHLLALAEADLQQISGPMARVYRLAHARIKAAAIARHGSSDKR